MTEVKVNGRDPVPLEGMVMLLAEIVKLGVAADAFALPGPKPSANSDTREINAVFLFMVEPPGRPSQQLPGQQASVRSHPLSVMAPAQAEIKGSR
ncbi:MAG: hypothetical protein ACRD28_05570 [Acidobacteriaceae bacterium]